MPRLILKHTVMKPHDFHAEQVGDLSGLRRRSSNVRPERVVWSRSGHAPATVLDRRVKSPSEVISGSGF